MKKRIFTLMLMGMLIVALVGCGSRGSSKTDIDSMSDEELEEYLDEQLEALDENEETTDEEDAQNENTIEYLASFDQFSADDWDDLTETVNAVFENHEMTTDIKMSDDTRTELFKMNGLSYYLSDLTAYEALLVNTLYGYDDGREWENHRLYVLCYVNGDNLFHYDSDGNRTDNISLSNMVCIISLGDEVQRISNGHFNFYHTNRSEILCYCENLDIAHDYITELNSTSEYLKDLDIQTYDISELNFALPE